MILGACGATAPQAPASSTQRGATAPAPTPTLLATAIFAGGCFWCMEKPFDQLSGVVATISGYTGGDLANPSYEQVSGGGTGHYEAVQIMYDPERISYQELLRTYWRQVDPLDGKGQFCDRGDSYRPAIFVANLAEEKAAQASLAEIAKLFERPVAVQVLPAKVFYAAEDYHQNFYQKNPLRYAYYRSGCGRDARLRAVWGP
ncbi:peptide-methionine (S)-S-oxide reductase MsrA [Candidatus Phycosocius spiralis]